MISGFVYFFYALIVFGAYRFLKWHIHTLASALPENHPAAYLTNQSFESESLKNDHKVMVCCGDSITHGTTSFDYVGALRKRVSHEHNNTPEIINAGVNSDLSWNLLHRVEEIIACNPDYVTILIGTNDINASFSDASWNGYRESKNITEKPNIQRFIQNIDTFVNEISGRTSARILVISMPLIGETQNSKEHQICNTFAEALKEFCESKPLDFYAFHEDQLRLLETQKRTDKTKRPFNIEHVKYHMNAAMWYRYVLQISWDTIGKWNGYTTLTDGIHLNKRSGIMLSDYIEKWYVEKSAGLSK